jgi:hypothetical protein
VFGRLYVVELLLETVLLFGVLTTVRFLTVLVPAFLEMAVFTFLEVPWAFCPPRLLDVPLLKVVARVLDLV